MFNPEMGEFTLKGNDFYKKLHELMMKYDTKVDQNLQGLMDEMREMQNKLNDIEMNLKIILGELNREILNDMDEICLQNKFNDMQRNTSSSREPNKEVICKKYWDSTMERVSSDDGGSNNVEMQLNMSLPRNNGGSNNNQMKNIGRLCFNFVILSLAGIILFVYFFCYFV